MLMMLFFFNDTATTEIYTLSLHDALPICRARRGGALREGRRMARHVRRARPPGAVRAGAGLVPADDPRGRRSLAEHGGSRSEEHTSELQSRQYLVCRLLLEKKNKNSNCSI